MTLRIVVLASCGRHPGSGRPRIVPSEARALALASTQPGAEIEVLHAGPATIALPALREALGMGATKLTMLDLTPGSDPLPVLIEALRARHTDIIMAGTQAEQSEGSGFLPYAIAEALGAALIASATDLALTDGNALVTQAASGGRRRQISAPMPLMLTVDAKGPAPRLAALGAMRRGIVSIEPAEALPDVRGDWASRPARPRAKRLSAPKAGGSTAPSKQMLRDLDADAAAQAILHYLQQEGLIRPSNRVS